MFAIHLVHMHVKLGVTHRFVPEPAKSFFLNVGGGMLYSCFTMLQARPGMHSSAVHLLILCCYVCVCAEWDTFRYYAEGVYTDSRCTTKSRDLDHAVVLFGYGTTPQGKRHGRVEPLVTLACG